VQRATLFRTVRTEAEESAMGDPVERIRLYVEDQKQQGRSAVARPAWMRRISDVVPAVEKVVDVMRQALVPEQFQGDVLSVLADTTRERFPLVVAFGRRVIEGRADAEVAASAVFRCETDGRVHGYRYPFHSVMKGLGPEPFVDLGEPEQVIPEQVGNAVADFLEWAATGVGCGGRRLQFAAPSTLPFVRPQVKRSGIAA
jgi:hypothetical protein